MLKEENVMEKGKFWEEHIRAQGASGLSIAKYCTKHGISVSSYGYWREKLKRQNDESGGFVEVGGSRDSLLEIRVGAHTLRVPQGYDAKEVRRIVEALSC